MNQSDSKIRKSLKKNLCKTLSLSAFSILILFAIPNTVYAVPPPDFLFSIGTQIAQTFSVVVIFLSAIFGVSYKYIQTRLILLKANKLFFWSVIVLVIVGISGGSAYFYSNYKQNDEYEKWLAESQKYAQLPVEEAHYLAKKKILRNPNPTKNTVDQLTIGETKEVKAKIKRASQAEEKFITNVDTTDKKAEFIKNYYQAIATHDFEKAYKMSKKSVNLETFKNWYNKTTKIVIDQISIINEKKLSLELTLYEDENYNRYGVLLDLKMENGTPIQIVSSDVRVLSEGQISPKKISEVANKSTESPLTNSSFFETNKNSSLSISNTAFQKILNDNSNFVVLDAREDLEYSNGYFSESTHVRFADLQAGEWIKLPTDKSVYVLCWSGIRGKEVATFLRSKNILASYLENGANGWVAFGGKWIGDIKFAEKYSEEKYKKLFSTTEVKKMAEEGVVLVDSRQPWKFEKSHIPGSVNIPIMYTPTIKITETFSQVPSNSKIIAICDDYVNCFDAKITGVELENRGHTFLGRYAKPWEYGK